MEPIVSSVKEMKNYLNWICKNYYTWGYLWDGYFTDTAKLDQIHIIEELKKSERYPQILNLVLDEHNEIRSIAVQAIIEEIIVTWEKEQWDEVVDNIIERLNKDR